MYKTKRLTVLIAALVTVLPVSAGTVGWYNGDFNDITGLTNEINTSITQSNVYDNFIVPTGGWTVAGLFSNNLMDFTASQAVWEIRSGLSSGNAGTLIAGGTSAVTQSSTGRSAFGMTEYTVEVDGLSVFLAPGTYWMTLAPVGSGSGRSFNTTTSGANAIGLPAGNDGNAFYDSSFFGTSFAPSTDGCADCVDFSDGVLIGEAGVPEPGTIGMVLGGLLLAGIGRLRRR